MSTGQFPALRLRRMRHTEAMRDLLADVSLTKNQLIQPIFIKAGTQIKTEISSMPGQYQYSLDTLPEYLERLANNGIMNLILFGIPSHKDATGSDALSSDGIIARSLSLIKTNFPEFNIIADTCFCEYTDHGHCGVMHHDEVDNDATLTLLGQQAVIQAQAGADIIAPSGMMDGMVSSIRHALDCAGFLNTPILSYAVKYASSFYGPFREAAQGAPQSGDRKTYQMDFKNSKQALAEAALDIQEGADMLMVKPAGCYLDVIQSIAQHYPSMPLLAYQVSGEYAMIKAASQQGWLDEKAVIIESLIAMKRAGADGIISYFANQIANDLI